MVTQPDLTSDSVEAMYSRSVFESIVRLLGSDSPISKYFRCDDRGAWVQDPHTIGELAWHPLCEIETPGSPNPLDEPWLPFPFTARQLAALMIDGSGYFIQERFGRWQDGADLDELAGFGMLDAKAKEAILAAYAAVLRAAELAPTLDTKLADFAEDCANQYDQERDASAERVGVREQGISAGEYSKRLSTLNMSLGELDRDQARSRLEADAAHASWRNAVVQHLLLSVDKVRNDAFGSEAFRALPPKHRAQAIVNHQLKRGYADSEPGKAHWALLREQSDTHQELRRSRKQLPTITSRKASIEEDKVAILEERLKELERSIAASSRSTSVQVEDAIERQRRRLKDYNSLEGKWGKTADGRWGAMRKDGALQKLINQEKASGARNASDKSIRADLTAAAIAVEDEKRSGIAFRQFPNL